MPNQEEKLFEAIKAMTPETIELLRKAKALGFSIGPCCRFASISEETFYQYQDIYPDFLSEVTLESLEHRIINLEREHLRLTGIDLYKQLTGRDTKEK